MSQKQKLRECFGFECGTVSDDKPVIPHVKILGWESRNNRRYLPESVQPQQYEDIPVNLNHPEGQSKQRVVQERFGWFENIRKEADGVYGDLHYNPELPYAKPFAWWAKHKPNKVFMSHDAVGTGRTENGKFIVEKAHPANVDIVADGATTKGLYESMDPDLTPAPDTPVDKSLEQQIGELIVAIIQDDCPAEEKRSKVMKALKLIDDEPKPEPAPRPEPKKEKTDESVKRNQDPAYKALLERVTEAEKKADAAQTKLALRERHELASRLCVEAKLPQIAVSERFLQTLIEAENEAEIKALIEDRKGLANIQAPRSAGAVSAQNIDNETFAKQLRS